MYRHFTEKGIRLINEHMKRYLTSLAMREMLIETSVRSYYVPVRVAAINHINTPCANENAEE